MSLVLNGSLNSARQSKLTCVTKKTVIYQRSIIIMIQNFQKKKSNINTRISISTFNNILIVEWNASTFE